MTESAAAPFKRMRLRYAGSCRSCGSALAAGETAVYHRGSKEVECTTCFDRTSMSPDAEPAPPVEDEKADSGTAGASARREHQRRVAKREERVRTRHPRIGGFILAVTDEPQSTRAWAVGAVGEEKLARRLDELVERGARVLHDRRIPGTRANIDHIVIGAAGIFVIDAKRYKGRPHLRIEGGILRPRTEKLMVGTRDCSKLLSGVVKQVDLVAAAVQGCGLESAPVRGMLCFVDADWPVLGGDFITSNVRVLWPKKIAQHVFATGTLTTDQVADVHGKLAAHFPPA